MAAVTAPRLYLTPTRHMRKFTTTALVTLLGLLVLLIFLMPLGYMSVTAVKNLQQIQDPNSQLLPASPVTFTYEGKELLLLNVPLPDGATRQLALYRKGREESDFIDPANPAAGRVRYELDLTPGGDLKVTSQPNESNVRSFSGAFVIRGFDLEDLAGVPDDAVIERGVTVEDVVLEPQQLMPTVAIGRHPDP